MTGEFVGLLQRPELTDDAGDAEDIEDQQEELSHAPEPEAAPDDTEVLDDDDDDCHPGWKPPEEVDWKNGGDMVEETDEVGSKNQAYFQGYPVVDFSRYATWEQVCDRIQEIGSRPERQAKGGKGRSWRVAQQIAKGKVAKRPAAGKQQPLPAKPGRPPRPPMAPKGTEKKPEPPKKTKPPATSGKKL